MSYHPTDDGIVEDGNIESNTHDVEADEVAFGEETAVADVLNQQYDTCGNGEDGQYLQTEHDSRGDVPIGNTLFQGNVYVACVIVIRNEQEIQKEPCNETDGCILLHDVYFSTSLMFSGFSLLPNNTSSLCSG